MTDISFEFLDSSGMQSGNLPWITIDKVTGEITVVPTWQEFIDYHGMTIDITIKATVTSDTTLVDSSASFPLNFQSTVLENCYVAVI